MKKITISPSILEYEHDIKGSMEKIKEILSCGIEYLHIDIMRKPFTQKNAFSEKAIEMLYREFHNEANFDFHLMVSNPGGLIAYLNKMVRNSDKENTYITIHREAYRKGLGMYESKDYDLLNIHDSHVREINEKTGKLIEKALKTIKHYGFKAGIALEPNTSIKNITDDMAHYADLILLMSVCSGAGSQPYKKEVTGKVKEARHKYKHKAIQVDGGINEKTIGEVIHAGASNIVIGSYITKADDPGVPITKIKRYIEPR